MNSGSLEVDETHDPSRASWVEDANVVGHDFPLQNLPLGVFSPGLTSAPRVGVAIGDHVLDLAAAGAAALLPEVRDQHLLASSLDGLLALGQPVLRRLRRCVFALLSTGRAANGVYSRREEVLHPLGRCQMQLPTSVPDFTDFYAGIEHARRAGAIARPGSTLAANYVWQPIAYHGRSSTVRVSGEPVRRPSGPRLPHGAATPVFGPSAALDFELELGLLLCGPAGASASIAGAAERIGGVCLLNDWSARDIQRWEMAPLGPFLGKSFATTISPWLVTLDALAPFRIPAALRTVDQPPLMAYLDDRVDQARGGLDIDLAVHLTSPTMRRDHLEPELITRSSSRHLFWTPAQMVAHQAANGCVLRPGDLLGTGTISGSEIVESGSLLELTHDARDPLVLPSKERRGYLEDGDEVRFSARCLRDGFVPIGFGRCEARVSPAGVPS